MLPPTPARAWPSVAALDAELSAKEWAQRPVSHQDLRDTIASVAAGGIPSSGIPVVADNAERSLRFPSPVGDERVDNKATGYRERYDATLAAWVPQLSPVLTGYDDFERADQIGLGTAKTGQAWTLSGAGLAQIQIQSGRYTMGAQAGVAGNGYAGLLLAVKPARYTGRFSFVTGTGGTPPNMMMACSSDTDLSLAHMLHLIWNATGWTLSTWNGAAQNIALVSSDNRSTFVSPLATDGTVYDIAVTLNGNHAHVELPDGTSADYYDPLISTITGRMVIYEHTYISTSSFVTRWESVATYSPSALTVTGPWTVPMGIQGPIGNLIPASGYFTQVGINQKSPKIGVRLHVADPIGTGVEIALFEHTTGHAIVRIKRTATGTDARMIFDHGSANPPEIGTYGNGQDLQIKVGGTVRLAFPLSGGSSAKLTGNPFEISAASVAAAAGALGLGGTQQTTVGATGAASALPANPLGYIKGFIGSTAIAIPYYNQ